MKISNIPSPDAKITSSTIARDAAPASRAQTSSTSQRTAPRGDAVSFSAEGRALAKSDSLSAERIGEVRMKILQKAYDNTDVLDALARNILRSGAL